MELTHSFTVDRPVDRTWEVITDLERAAPCLAGAALLDDPGPDASAAADEGRRGAVTVTVGPITARYEGVVRFAERDDAGHRAVLRAEGRDARGQGDATATVDLRLRPQGSGTLVTVDTDLVLGGRVAQFGRGVVADVSGKLVRGFAQRLEAEIAPTPAVEAAVPATAPPTPPPVPPAPEVEPLDLGSAGAAAFAAVARRQAAPVLAALLGLVAGWLLGRSGPRTGASTADTKGN